MTVAHFDWIEDASFVSSSSTVRGQGRTTIGVSPNIIEASWRALEDSLVYGLLHSR